MVFFRHIPFILFELKNNKHLQDAWTCVQSLLKIVQVVYSNRISENDINDLEDQVELHLNLIQKVFGINLLPKHHFMTHYGTVIRSMGPLVFMSMMRFEAMHQNLKRLIESARNFVNITKTITKKHQAQSVLCDKTFSRDIQCGSKIPYAEMKSKIDQQEQNFISRHFACQDELLVIKYFSLNSFVYRKDLLFMFDKKMFQIENLYFYRNEHFFTCNQWTYVGFDGFLNSLEIKKSDIIEKKLIGFSELNEKNLFECKQINGKCYIVADTLSI